MELGRSWSKATAACCPPLFITNPSWLRFALIPPQVELLLAFDFEEREYNLVRMMDPVLLVGKVSGDEGRIELLSDRDADVILPVVEDTFMREMAKP